MFLQIRVPESHHNRHGGFELLYEVLQFLLNWVWIQGTLNSLADLCVFLGKLLNARRIDLAEIWTFPFFGHGAPLFEWVPEQVTVDKICAQLVQILEVSCGNKQFILPVVVALTGVLVLFIKFQLSIKLFNYLRHFLWLHAGDGVELTVSGLFVQLIDCRVQLRDQFLKSLLELLRLGLLLLLEPWDNLI